MSQIQNPRDTSRGSSNPNRTTVTRNAGQSQRPGYAPDTVAEKGKGGKGKK